MEQTYDYVIAGAGPAGLQLAYYLEKQGHSYIVLEKSSTVGNYFSKFPRHRTLISINKVYTGYDDQEVNLRWDWNSLLCDSEKLQFKNYSRDYFPKADDLVKYLGDFAKHYELNIAVNSEITRISKDDVFSIETATGEQYKGKRVIISTGMFKPFVPAIKGISCVSEFYSNVTIDPEDFIGQKVLIVGKGNSAFEMADSLVGTTSLIHMASPNPLKMAWRTHYVGHLRAVNNNMLDTYMLKSQNVVINGDIESIAKVDGKYRVTFDYNLASGEVEFLDYDRVILATGFKFDDEIFDESCKPKLTINNRFPDMSSEWESTNIADLYFSGVLMHMRDFKKKQSGFIHGFRYNIEALSKMFQKKYDDIPLPCHIISKSIDEISDFTIKRLNRTSALWQQNGFLCDVIIYDSEKSEHRYYESLPLDYAHEVFSNHEHYYILTLEFGQEIIDDSRDVFSIERIHKNDYQKADASVGLHPIIKRYREGEHISTQHLIEDIASEWNDTVHDIPMKEYFERNHELSASPVL